MNEIINFIKEENLGLLKENVSFKVLTTYKTGGNAKFVFYPNNTECLIKFINKAKAKNIDYKIFGNGSNILASDDEYDGIIVKLSNFNNYIFDEEKQILELEAGCSLQMIANTFSKKGYSGLEFACGIPGSIGGAIFMNAGAYLKSMSDIVIDVTLIDENNEIKVLSNEEMKFSYRKSIFSENKYICLKTRLQLKKAEKEEIINLTKDRLHRRLQTQPLQYPSAGSVFRNPDGDYAGRLIEECQLKGMVYGGAEISEKHANFIVNKNEAKSSDIKYLMDLAEKEVFEKFNIKLHKEQELFNFK